MKALIAVVNCRSRQDNWARAIRETWMPKVPSDRAEVRFFVGRGEGEMPADTVVLDCDDSYQGLPEKIRAIARWAVAEDRFHHMLKCDDDVILNPTAVLDSGYDLNDYTGRLNRPKLPDRPFVVPMGFNYWLSRRCMDLVAAADLPENSNDDEKWVAGVLYAAGIELVNDNRYRLHYGLPPRALRMPQRPLSPAFADNIPGEFSWCVFLEGNNGAKVSLERKLGEFYRVFQRI